MEIIKGGMNEGNVDGFGFKRREMEGMWMVNVDLLRGDWIVMMLVFGVIVEVVVCVFVRGDNGMWR